MHTYPNYHPPAPREAVDFVLANPFAVMVTSASPWPIATHVVTVPAPGVEPGDSLVGATFWAHMGRANRHWRLVEERPEALFVHSSSHGYVSPSHYDFDPAVPTVDYTAVHLETRLEVHRDPARVLQVVEHTVDVLESRRDPAWDKTSSRDLFARLAPLVVAFEVTVTGEQAVFKLSQDMHGGIRDNLSAEFTAPGCPHADLATLMARLPDEHVRRDHFPAKVED